MLYPPDAGRGCGSPNEITFTIPGYFKRSVLGHIEKIEDSSFDNNTSTVFDLLKLYIHFKASLLSPQNLTISSPRSIRYMAPVPLDTSFSKVFFSGFQG